MTKEKEERRLTAKEESRRAAFTQLKEELSAQGYIQQDLTLSAAKINIISILVTLPIIVVATIIYAILHGMPIGSFSGRKFILFYIFLLLSFVIHEGIHGLTWSRFCKKGWKAIDFGMIWKYLTPYCTCNECLNYKQYKIGALMPTIILGGLSYMLALVMGSYGILFYSILMIVGGGGDLCIILLIRKHKEAIFIDHPWEPGCVAFEKEDRVHIA
ncbi:MAG: DUF3267 domain-containing protein [Cellulosilyticum sp.]|nr:DUF3267 domain-containing protein [Cellulosilyticum sp.]